MEARRIIRASADRIFTHLGRLEYFPRYGAPLWMAAEPVEKRRSGRLITLTGYFVGLPVESVLRVTLRPPQLMEFKQARGTLRALAGECALQPVDDGTEVRYRMDVDPGIAMISDEGARQFLVQFVERMLDRIKLAAERKAPARRPERVGAPASSAEPADDEEAEPAAPAPPGETAVAAAPPPRPAEAAVGRNANAARAHAASGPPAGQDAAVPKPRPRKRRRRRHRGRHGPAPAEGPPPSGG